MVTIWEQIRHHDRKTQKLVLNGFAAVLLGIVTWIPASNIARDAEFIFRTNYNRAGQSFKEKISKRDSIKVTVPNKDKDFFYVGFKDSLKIEPSIYQGVSQIIVISDIEGNFNGLYSFLIANKVIDKNYNWIFGNGHIVFLGDFVDRGEESVAVVWLIYKLEQEATQQGGRVHYILGNHEVLNIQGAGYSDNKYVNGDQQSTSYTPFDDSHKIFSSKKSELGKWLRTKNSIEKIGNYTFVHGGLSPKVLSFKPDFDKINNTIRENIGYDLYNYPQRNKLANLLMGREGPFWFRGLAMKYKYYDKVTPSEFKQLQAYFNISKIVVGHTPVNDIQEEFEGDLIRVDVMHGHEKFSGRTRGLLIENDVEYKIDDNGNRSKL